MVAAAVRYGSSEDVDMLAFRYRAQSSFLPDRIGTDQQVDPAAQDFGQGELDAAHIEGAEQRLAAGGALIEIDHEIDVASVVGLIAGDGAEEEEALDAEGFQALPDCMGEA